ncbi:MAG: PorT family protein [Bacteroidota bacterium]|nr:PorT family protein [Bacteroidota bacterium]
MKKFLLLSLALICFKAAELRAQDIQYGIRAGINNSNWGGNATDFLEEVISFENAFSTRNRTGYQFGGYLVLPITSKFVVEPALMYSTKGQEVYQNLFKKSFLNPRLTVSNNSHYIDLPIMAKYYIKDGFHVFGGPQVSYMLFNKIKTEAGILGMDVIDQNMFLNAPLRKFDFSMAAGIGYQFQNGINISAGYDHGFTSLDKWGRTDINNRVIRASVGYTFK